MKLFIGLMGVENDRKTLVSPSGKRLFKVPSFLAWRIQRIQHWIAIKTWKFDAQSNNSDQAQTEIK